MNTMFHPAPGLGDLLPGWFVVPQNPVRDAETVLVPSVQALAPGAILKKPHIGDFVGGTFTVPQNPIRKSLATGMNGLNAVGCGCGGSCEGGANFYGMSGLGATAPSVAFSQAFSSMSNFQTWLQEPSPVSASIPNWMLYGGGAVAAYLLMKGKGGKR